MHSWVPKGEGGALVGTKGGGGCTRGHQRGRGVHSWVPKGEGGALEVRVQIAKCMRCNDL